MPLFSFTDDRKFLEHVNKEIYGLYFHEVSVYKLEYLTPTVDDIYHEDVNTDILDDPTYIVPGYINVSSNGMANLVKGGQYAERPLTIYFSRKYMEDVLLRAGLDIYRDIPYCGDVIRIQNYWFEIVTGDPADYHMNDRDFPFDYEYIIQTWNRDAIQHPRFRRR